MTSPPDTFPPTLVLTASQVTRLRDHLLREDGRERMAVAYCSPSGDDRLLVDELVEIPDGDLATQSRTACRPTLDVERDVLCTCCRRDMYPLVLHSHPFDTDGAPWFSPRDHDLLADQHTMLTGLYPDRDLHVLFGVLGQDGLTVGRYDPATDAVEDVPVTVHGHRLLDPPLHTPEAVPPVDPFAAPDSEVATERQDRTIRTYGEPQVRKLAGAHIAVVGCGGLGFEIATSLARSGVRELTLIDPDIVEESNLPRLRGAAPHHTGRPKVAVLEEAVWRANPDSTVTTVQATAEDAADALKQCDLVVAGVDQISCRMWLNQWCARHLLPYVDAGVKITTTDEEDVDEDESSVDDPGRGHAAGSGDESPRIASMEGFVHRIVPTVTSCFDCLRRADPEAAHLERLSDAELEEEVERGYVDADVLTPEPSVLPLNQTVAGYTVQLVERHLTGSAPPADFLHVDTVSHDVTRLNAKQPRPDCPTCQADIVGRGDRIETAVAGRDDRDLDTGLPADQPASAAHSVPATRLKAGFAWLLDAVGGESR